MNNFISVEKETISYSISDNQFWKGVFVWMKSPHVLNRRLCGVKTIIYNRVLEPGSSSDIIERLVKIREDKLVTSCKDTNARDLIDLTGIKLDSSTSTGYPNDDSVILKIRELIPKNKTLFQSCWEAIIMDGHRKKAIFIHLGPFSDTLSPATPYCVKLKQEQNGAVIDFCLWTKDKATEEGADSWLRTKLFPRLVKWIVLEHNPSSALPESSLNLVDLNEYNEKYQELKKKYGPQMVEIWPEQTDPLKFVYEDLAIASYLLCLWNCQEGDKKVSFVDLGCGNGLLVHILSSEGHPGLGVDVRSRKLWSLYPPTTKLEVSSVTPSPDTTFPEYDWLIGNHSDELTPWIPVMAALSTPQTNFFLLPCCAHDFFSKYQRLNATDSQYTEYMKFIRTVGETCGFKVEIDKLRIPSTKRTCLVGRQRYKNVEKTILWEYVNSRKQTPDECFNPRPAEEKVRNCTKLASGVTETVVKLVTDRLLSGFLQSDVWWEGNALPLAEAADLLSQSLRSELKKECGGLQTLLRNHHSIFIVQGGVVKFRRPKSSNRSELSKWKNKACWFFINHPQGCPLEEENCSFDHRCVA